MVAVKNGILLMVLAVAVEAGLEHLGVVNQLVGLPVIMVEAVAVVATTGLAVQAHRGLLSLPTKRRQPR